MWRLENRVRELDLQQARILMVDDTPTNLDILRRVLNPQGYKLSFANSGAQALKLAQNAPPDLILLDVMMPIMDGYETCRQLKANPGTATTPVIFITAKTDNEGVLEGFNAGAVDYVFKPFHAKEVLARVQTHLTLRLLQKRQAQINLELEARVAERTAQLENLNRAYQRFVPIEFLRYLDKKSITDVALGDQAQHEMTILFSDIFNFTSTSERMTPAENFEFLNNYLRFISPIIRQHHGFIDKYIGDGIMALFPGHPQDAVKAALDMRLALAEYNAGRRRQGLPTVNAGTGIHYGALMLGILGESERMEGTVIGDSVNLAARLEKLTRKYHIFIAVSEQVHDMLPAELQAHSRFVGKVQVKGKQEVVSVHEMVAADNPEVNVGKLNSKTDFERALKLYQEQKFERARDLFAYVMAQNPADATAFLYKKRCERFLAHGIPDDWSTQEPLDETACLF
jgi:two-component system sensor histidine kinase ChiS